MGRGWPVFYNKNIESRGVLLIDRVKIVVDGAPIRPNVTGRAKEIICKQASGPPGAGGLQRPERSSVKPDVNLGKLGPCLDFALGCCWAAAVVLLG